MTPTSFVNVTRWTRTQTNRLLFDIGFGIYDQEYTELYQPNVLGGFSDKVWNSDAIRASNIYAIIDQATTRRSSAWNAPADHFSLLRTYSGSVSYVTGSHNFKFGTAISEGNWRLLEEFTGDVSSITYNSGNPVNVILRLPTDRRNHIKADVGIYAQDRWSMGRATLNLGLRYDWFQGATGEGEVLPNRYNAGFRFGKCADGQNDLAAGCVGKVQDWKDISPRVGVAYDVFGNGRTAIKGSVARYVAGQQIAVANANNPVTALGLTETRGWVSCTPAIVAAGGPCDSNGDLTPFGPSGFLNFNELGPSPSNTFGQNISTTSYSDRRAERVVQARATTGSTALPRSTCCSAGPPSMAAGSAGASATRRSPTTFAMAPSDYDGPFCINAPADVNLPDGGGSRCAGSST